MLQLSGPSTLGPHSAPNIDGTTVKILELQGRAMDLQLRLSDLGMRSSQFEEQRQRATGADRERLDKQRADVQHDLTVAAIQLDATREQLAQLQKTQDSRVASTTQPAPDPLFGQKQLENVGLGAFILMIPIVLAYARRIWMRSGPRGVSPDLESSPRLQRMEQAIESIAIEVERIGEAQRFSTKLLTERQSDPIANRIAPVATPISRREPGTITPH
jgi:hypothetical protein